MIRSMTAFSRQDAQFEWGSLSWELRTVNHRYLESTPRLPEEFRVIENQIRQMISEHLSRGKVDCTLRFQASDNHKSLELNSSIVNQLRGAIGQLQQQYPNLSPTDPLALLQWPGVIQTRQHNFEEIHQQSLQLLSQGLLEIVSVREREGQELKRLLQQRCTAILEQVSVVHQRMPEVIGKFRDKLSSRIMELCNQVDPQRIEQEIALLAQKCDISEETDRLQTHIQEVLKVLEQNQPVGRRLDFLMQELHREANTLSAKSIDTTVTQCAIELKVLIEQMREQVQNIE